MKKISKNQEPNSLVEHRANRASSFDNIPNKKFDLRESLINEQGFICCYCMQRIKLAEFGRLQSTKIEHFACRSNNPDLELNYRNLLLSCMGGEGLPKQLQTCDTFKGEKVLSFNPCDNHRSIEDLIKYKANGEIDSDDQRLKKELEDVLNLNNQDLVKNRRIQFESIQKMIRDEGNKQKGKALRKKYFEDKKNGLLSKCEGKFYQFCMIGVYILNKKLKK